jgi:HEAT repeat protein
LAALLKDDDFVVREWAAQALNTIGPAAKAAVPALEAALEDADPYVKEVAAGALRAIQKAQQ